MLKQNKTKLQFVLAGALMLTFAIGGCNNSTEKKETVVTPAPTIKDSIDTMVKTPGSVAPVHDIKPPAQ